MQTPISNPILSGFGVNRPEESPTDRDEPLTGPNTPVDISFKMPAGGIPLATEPIDASSSLFDEGVVTDADMGQRITDSYGVPPAPPTVPRRAGKRKAVPKPKKKIDSKNIRYGKLAFVPVDQSLLQDRSIFAAVNARAGSIFGLMADDDSDQPPLDRLSFQIDPITPVVANITEGLSAVAGIPANAAAVQQLKRRAPRVRIAVADPSGSVVAPVVASIERGLAAAEKKIRKRKAAAGGKKKKKTRVSLLKRKRATVH